MHGHSQRLLAFYQQVQPPDLAAHRRGHARHLGLEPRRHDQRIHLLDTENPYNTYTHTGLPPGPIGNPGRASLAAVMRPDGSPYLYYVASRDGVTHFSTTVAEHEAAVSRYQRGGKPMPKPQQ